MTNEFCVTLHRRLKSSFGPTSGVVESVTLDWGPKEATEEGGMKTGERWEWRGGVGSVSVINVGG